MEQPMNNRLYFSIVGAFIVLSLAATWLVVVHLKPDSAMLIVGGLCGIVTSVPVSLALVGALICLRDRNRPTYLESEPETPLTVHIALRDSLKTIYTETAPAAPLQLSKTVSESRD
jgi:hypothetical protein